MIPQDYCVMRENPLEVLQTLLQENLGVIWIGSGLIWETCWPALLWSRWWPIVDTQAATFWWFQSRQAGVVARYLSPRPPLRGSKPGCIVYSWCSLLRQPSMLGFGLRGHLKDNATHLMRIVWIVPELMVVFKTLICDTGFSFFPIFII